MEYSEECRVIGPAAFMACTSMYSIQLSPKIEEIGHDAFAYCGNMSQYDLPDSLRYIGDRAFRGNTSLEEMNISDSVKYIGEETFSYCSSLTSIGDGAFQGCTGGLEGFDLSDKVTTIGESAFADCGTIGYVTLPESITSIGTNAFNGSNIGKLFVGWDEPIQVETNTFSRVDTMYCPSGSVTNYRYVRGWNVAKWYISTENPVGIEGIEANKEEDDVYYNLEGIRVENPSEGIYIHNGKKVLIRRK